MFTYIVRRARLVSNSILHTTDLGDYRSCVSQMNKEQTDLLKFLSDFAKLHIDTTKQQISFFDIQTLAPGALRPQQFFGVSGWKRDKCGNLGTRLALHARLRARRNVPTPCYNNTCLFHGLFRSLSRFWHVLMVEKCEIGLKWYFWEIVFQFLRARLKETFVPKVSITNVGLLCSSQRSRIIENCFEVVESAKYWAKVEVLLESSLI